MTGKQSRGYDLVIWKCEDCEYERAYHKYDPHQAVFDSWECDGRMNRHEITSVTPPPPRKTRSVGTLTIDVEVTDALTGLKAVQREAKKATAALKELESMQTRMAYIQGGWEP